MRYVTFGNSGLRVSELALGTMRMPHEEGRATPESRAIFEAFVGAGGNFVDTADAYGEAELLTRELVGSEREQMVIGSKYTLQRRERDVNSAGSHRKNLIGALESSLRRLGTDYLDVYWVHARDVLSPVEEIMRALDDQVRAGKVLYLGVPDWHAWEVARANTLAALRSWTPFSGLQVPYSLVERTVERELIPMATELDLTVTAWSPLAGGQLARGDDGPVTSALRTVAGEIGATPTQVAIGWLRRRPGRVSRSSVPATASRCVRTSTPRRRPHLRTPRHAREGQCGGPGLSGSIPGRRACARRGLRQPSRADRRRYVTAIHGQGHPR